MLACSDSDKTEAPITAQPTSDYWDRLQAAIELVRTSPDHLPAERDRIVAAGDVEAAIEFVRTSFRVMPDSLDGYRFPVRARRWGPQGALRSGMGTPRDLADLLRGMLADMGHEAVVVDHRFDPVRDLHAYSPPPFEPAGDVRSLGPAPGPRPPEVDPITANEVEGIAAEVVAAVPPQMISARLVMDAPTRLPTVQLSWQDGIAVADLWGIEGGLVPLDRAASEIAGSDIATVTVRLKTLSLGERNPVTVAELTAALDRLLGRQVQARFAPAVESPLELLDRRPVDLDVFLPTLFVPGEDDLVATGTPIDLSGARLQETRDGFSNGRQQVTSTADAADVARVEILRVDATRFPDVELVARIEQADGASLAGVPAAALAVTEQGERRHGRLLGNNATDPRVLFLVDGSRSVPPEYRGAGAGEVVRTVAEGILEAIPDAEFMVTVETNGLADPRTGWTRDPAALERPAQAMTFSSQLWDAYADAHERFAPDVIVMTTDGVSQLTASEMQPTPGDAVEARLRAAVPAVMLGSGELGEAFEGIARLTRGVALAIEDPVAGIEAATAKVLESANEVEYRVRFRAAEAGPMEREVSLAAGDQSGTATYVVPDATGPVHGRHLAGLYLEIEYPTGSRPVARRLAGLELDRVPHGGATSLAPTLAEDVRVALFGQWSLSVDGGAPSPSQLLEQLFRHRLSMKAFFEAETADEFAAGMEAIQPLSEHALLFSTPLAGAQAGRVYEQGARFWLETHRRTVTADGEFEVKAVDLLPFTVFDAVIGDPADAFAATAAASTTLAVIEARAFEQSALGRLEEAGDLGFQNIEDRNLAVRMAEAYRGFSFVAPQTGPQDAAWAVDRRSGSLLPVLEDGTGGGLTVSQVVTTWKTIDKGLELAGIVDGVPTSITLWAQLERVKIAKLANSTIAILTMGTDDFSPPEDPNFDDAQCEAAETAVNNFAGGFIGSGTAGKVVGIIGKINDWGEFTGFGGTGIPTSLPLCP